MTASAAGAVRCSAASSAASRLSGDERRAGGLIVVRAVWKEGEPVAMEDAVVKAWGGAVEGCAW